MESRSEEQIEIIPGILRTDQVHWYWQNGVENCAQGAIRDERAAGGKSPAHQEITVPGVNQRWGNPRNRPRPGCQGQYNSLA